MLSMIRIVIFGLGIFDKVEYVSVVGDIVDEILMMMMMLMLILMMIVMMVLVMIVQTVDACRALRCTGASKVIRYYILVAVLPAVWALVCNKGEKYES